MLIRLLPVILIGLIACGPTQPDAQFIIDRAIERAGGDAYLDTEIEFKFRQHHYRTVRQGGLYSHHRMGRDSTGTIEDIIDNDGYKRLKNGQEVAVVDSMAVKYASSVNSVVYFALLPYGLNDVAVVKEFLGETELEGQPLFLVRISFREEGGGEDFEDVFLYWIHRDTYTIEYMAYTFHVNGGGIRFRKALNPRVVGGIRFADYENYAPQAAETLEDLGQAFEEGRLKLLSTIQLEEIKVR
jgi:hypothetical protein